MKIMQNEFERYKKRKQGENDNDPGKKKVLKNK